jgi:hypothetical protein
MSQQFREYEQKVRKASFVLCPSCYWCATYFATVDDKFPECPVCRSVVIDSIQISESEFYHVNITENGNVELRFRRGA